MRSSPESLDAAFPPRTRADWERAALASLADGTTLDSLLRHTLDALPIPPLADGSPVEGRALRTDAARSASETSEAPAPWDNRLRVLGDDAPAARAHALAGLADGVDSLEIEVRRAASAATSRDGAPAIALAALGAMLDGVHLEMIGLSLRAGDDAAAALETLETLARERGLAPEKARLSVDADPVGELARAGRLAGGLDAGLERMGEAARRAAERLPAARAVAVDTTVHHDAGASSVQELVAAIWTATLYVERLVDAGLDADSACRTIVFRLACDADLPAGVVKLRALERLWRHVREASALPTTRATLLVETSHRQLSRRAPRVNHLRNTLSCAAAAIGGASIIVPRPHDLVDGRRVALEREAGADPDRLARVLPLLLAEECAMGRVFDPSGGAHAIESLTQSTVEAVWQALGELQDEGGLARALERGSWQAALAASRRGRARALVGGEAVMVGVNRFGDASSDGDAPEGMLADADADDAAPASPTVAPPATADAATGAPFSRVAPLPPWREARAFESAAAAQERA